MWKRILERRQNLTAKSKNPEKITAAAAAEEFRELFKNNTYQSKEVVKEIKVVDSTHTFTPLEKQIAMFPEAGEFLPSLDLFLTDAFDTRRLSYVQNSSDEQDQHGTIETISLDHRLQDLFKLCFYFQVTSVVQKITQPQSCKMSQIQEI